MSVIEAEAIVAAKQKVLQKVIQGLKIQAHQALRSRGVKVAGVYTCYKKSVALHDAKYKGKGYGSIQTEPHISIYMDALDQPKVVVDPGVIYSNNCNEARKVSLRPRKDGTFNFAIAADRFVAASKVYEDQRLVKMARVEEEEKQRKDLQDLAAEIGVGHGQTTHASLSYYGNRYGQNDHPYTKSLCLNFQGTVRHVSKKDAKRIAALLNKINAIAAPYVKVTADRQDELLKLYNGGG
jgi:hypothetical protein